ncbi:hypothetical protein D3C85_1563150 [compost metagenome]
MQVLLNVSLVFELGLRPQLTLLRTIRLALRGRGLVFFTLRRLLCPALLACELGLFAQLLLHLLVVRTHRLQVLLVLGAHRRDLLFELAACFTVQFARRCPRLLSGGDSVGPGA